MTLPRSQVKEVAELGFKPWLFPLQGLCPPGPSGPLGAHLHAELRQALPCALADFCLCSQTVCRVRTGPGSSSLQC